MFGGSVISMAMLAGAVVVGFVAGATLSRLLGSAGSRPLGKRADEMHHRIRALEADLRVAQRSVEQGRSERDSAAAEVSRLTAELAAARSNDGDHAETIRKLKAEVQHECAKTARLRQELADRAEEMVRTHVQLRDVQNELGVSQVGSDVIVDQINRLERERQDLSVMVEALRKEIAARPRSDLYVDS
jgi:chromosome segregation ATPase